MSTLYEITGEYCTLLEYADSMDPDDEKVFLDTLESIEGELSIKAENYAAIIKEIDAEAKKFDDEIKRLEAKRDVMKNNIKHMKAALLNVMNIMGLDEIKTDHFKLKICKNGGKQPLKLTGEVPDSYQRIIYEPDTDKIRETLESGKELDFAYLEERGKHLRIS